MFCIKCGKELQDGAIFCIGCGAKVSGASSEPVQEVPSGEKKVFEPLKAVSAAAGNITAVKTNKKLLIMVGSGLAAILIIIMLIVIIAVNTKKTTTSGTGKTPPKDVDFYFDRPLMLGQIVEFGEYEQDGNTANGKEPIKWQVVEASNDRYLLVAHNVLDVQPWDDGSVGGDIGGLSHGSNFLYEDSSLRRWLNNSFDSEAFGEKEKKYIIPVSFRNDVMTVSKDNQYGRDCAFILSAKELESYFPASAAGWKKCAPPTQYAVNKGVHTDSVQIYLDNYLGGIGMDYPDDTAEDRSKTAQSVFNNSQTDYFDMGCVSTYHLRDTDKSSKQLTVFYGGRFNDFETVSASVKNGVRPAVYISADACHVEEVVVDETLGSAEDKITEYKGKYYGPEGFGGGNYVFINVQQLFIDVRNDEIFPMSANEDLKFIFWGYQKNLVTGRLKVSDFSYTVEDGKDCFTNNNKGVRFVFDPKTEELQWYLKFPEGTDGLPPGKADQWLLYFTLLTEDKYRASGGFLI